MITNPAGAWGRAGLHTGDRLVALNGGAVATVADFRSMVAGLRIGDTTSVEVRRPIGAWRTSVVVAGYERPVVRLEEIPDATGRQRGLRASWSAGSPR